MPGLTTRRPIARGTAGAATHRVDDLAVEEPLALVAGDLVLATTMRSPGHDLDLAAGWLVAEAGVRREADIVELAECPVATRRSPVPGVADGMGAVRIRLAGHVGLPAPRLAVTTSSCGACGPRAIVAPRPADESVPDDWSVPASIIAGLPERMRLRQRAFHRAGSLHAGAVVDPARGDRDEAVLVVREDVGRHNAVDKAVGALLLAGRLPLTGLLLVVSGRVSFEIVQKAVAASLAGIVAVSAPTSLAVDLAVGHGLLLVGMCRNGVMNVYARPEAVSW